MVRIDRDTPFGRLYFRKKPVPVNHLRNPDLKPRAASERVTPYTHAIGDASVIKRDLAMDARRKGLPELAQRLRSDADRCLKEYTERLNREYPVDEWLDDKREGRY